MPPLAALLAPNAFPLGFTEVVAFRRDFGGTEVVKLIFCDLVFEGWLVWTKWLRLARRGNGRSIFSGRGRLHLLEIVLDLLVPAVLGPAGGG
jgi:hypothetical protein